MKKLLVFSCWLLVSLFAEAHPGIGIVKDSKGNIYYTDLKQVWKITPGGDKTVVVTRVHTHELYIDPQDNLYGEHLWYNGEAADTWGHYTWCLKNNGELTREKPVDGFLNNYSFARDDAGNMYWVERFTTSRIMKKNTSGEVKTILERKFGFIGWIYVSKNGSVYFTESNKLHQLLPSGKLETLAESIGSKSVDMSVMGRNYNGYGIWTDASDNVYIAMPDARKVIRIGVNGKPETILTSNATWMITSGVFDDNGDMWVLENSITNEVRVKKMTSKELAKGNLTGGKATNSHLFITILTAIAIALLVLIIKLVLNKKRKQIHLAI